MSEPKVGGSRVEKRVDEADALGLPALAELINDHDTYLFIALEERSGSRAEDEQAYSEADALYAKAIQEAKQGGVA